jgi:hypothetical protein
VKDKFENRIEALEGFCWYACSMLRLMALQTAIKLVAESCANGDFVTALGATPVENSSTSLGFHAGKKPVGLRAVAAVGLEGTLRHGNGS